LKRVGRLRSGDGVGRETHPCVLHRPDANLVASVDERNTASFKLLSRLGRTVFDESNPLNLLLRRPS
jgi:hypothetical protein